MLIVNRTENSFNNWWFRICTNKDTGQRANLFAPQSMVDFIANELKEMFHREVPVRIQQHAAEFGNPKVYLRIEFVLHEYEATAFYLKWS